MYDDEKLEYCAITKAQAIIKTQYNVTTKKNYCEGVEIYADAIYSPCRGVIIGIQKFGEYLGITLQYSHNISLRFLHLDDVVVKESQIVIRGQLLGYAKKYVHFEYLTSEKSQIGLQVCIPPNICLYKHSPIFILRGTIGFDETPLQNRNIMVHQALMEDGKGLDE